MDHCSIRQVPLLQLVRFFLVYYWSSAYTEMNTETIIRKKQECQLHLNTRCQAFL